MQLLTDAIKKALPPLYSTEDRDWLLFGKCDLGFDMAEWGYVSLSELEALDVGLGMGLSLIHI